MTTCKWKPFKGKTTENANHSTKNEVLEEEFSKQMRRKRGKLGICLLLQKDFFIENLIIRAISFIVFFYSADNRVDGCCIDTNSNVSSF